ncbi:two-component sensor histidine kinase [Actinoplanes cyaneus]|uniref:histidine kinase n=1 Tax=Actinoplanes cyaneus TaxID=52696 RepID=A0A919M974_9ACTN|nr:HAMP domain-containing sensor histidine kinase [Actinoplanes cyaneus]MCW2141170.1 two-component system, OmpR family, sensor histidine kinase BaeS [Actinoplanes cyaneus]GID67234.1 two-component sensor histidine kinase [Actinoplanes cyaneus]
MGTDVPLRRSLITRLLATSILIAVAAITATAWLTVRSTTRAIERQQDRTITGDTQIYDTLIGYAATHTAWDDVTTTVAELSQRTGHRVTLLTRDRQVIADSAPGGPDLRAAQPSATVDPLRVDGSRTTAIDARVVGPYRLTAAERRELDGYAERDLRCLRGNINARIVHLPSGRPVITLPGAVDGTCRNKDILAPTPTEEKALRALTKLMDTCLQVPTATYFRISPQFEILPMGRPLPRGVSLDDVQECLQSARQVQLAAYVAPPALLFITDADRGPAPPPISLTRPNLLRIAGGTGLVLAVAVAVTVLAGLRLVRPLRRLTEHARQPVDQQRQVPVGTRDEIGYLAIALNDLTRRRETLEAQRQALVNDLAHELRTPLTNIRSWIEAAQDGMAPTDSQLLDVLADETALLQRIVEDLRDLAAADSGSLRLHPEFVYVNDVLTQVVDAHRGVADEHGVTLSTDFTADLQMSADPVRLRQLVGNLVANAIRHTDPGGLVQVRTAVAASGLVVEVADTGVGIAPGDLEKIFDRFWRTDSSRSRSTGGSGLGLAIVRKLAEAHDGHVTVTSRPGVGSTFRVSLPLSRQAPADAAR